MGKYLNAQVLGVSIKRIRSGIYSARHHFFRGGWASVEALVAPVVMIALSPWMLQRLGADKFGQWTLALAVAGFANVVSLGAGPSTMFAVARFAGKENISKAIEAIKAGFSVALITSAIFMTFACVVSEPIAKAAFVKMGDPDNIGYVLLLGACALVLQEIDSVFAGALRGMHRYDLVGIAEIFGRLVWAASIVSITLITTAIIPILTTHIIYCLLRLIIRIRIVKSVFGESCIKLPVSKNSILNIINFGKWISVQSIGGVLFSTMDKFVVGWLFGSSELSRYSLCLQLVQFLHNVQASAFQIITPVVVNKNNNNEEAKVKFNYLNFSAWIGAACLIIPLFMLAAGYDIMGLWLGSSFANDNITLLRILIVGGAILAFTIPAHYVLLGLGKARLCAIILFVAGSASLMFSASLAAYGILGFAIGRMAYGAITFLYFIAIHRSNSECVRI